MGISEAVNIAESVQSPMKISVVVPVRNEQDSIRALLDQLVSQTLPPTEIVITDGGSDDATVEIISEYIRRGAPIVLIKAGAALPGRGRNLAAAAASSEWLAFVDAGIRPGHDWLELLARKAGENDNADIIYGSWSPVINNLFEECAAIAYVPPPTPLRPRFIASSLMRKSVWEAVGGFPESLRSAEDLIFMNNLDEAGFHSVFEPAALVHWSLRPTFASTFKRFVVYSRNNIRAGLWRQWQASLVSRYVILALLFIPGILFSVLWLLPPLLWLGMLTARAVVAIRRNRFCYPASVSRNLKRILVIIPMLATIDLAAIVGTVEWLLKDSFRWNLKNAEEAGHGT